MIAGSGRQAGPSPQPAQPRTWLAQKPQFIGSLVTSMHSPPHILPGAGQSPDGVGLVGAGLSDGGGEAGESAGEAGTSAGEAGGTEGLSGDGEGSEVGGGAVVLPLPAEVLRKPELQVIAGPWVGWGQQAAMPSCWSEVPAPATGASALARSPRGERCGAQPSSHIHALLPCALHSGLQLNRLHVWRI